MVTFDAAKVEQLGEEDVVADDGSEP